MMTVATLAPGITAQVKELEMVVFSFSAGLAGGQLLKAKTAHEALFIHSLVQGPGIQLGRRNFWNAYQGAPFLMAWNPMVYVPTFDCHSCPAYGFDPHVPLYGATANDEILVSQRRGTSLGVRGSSDWKK